MSSGAECAPPEPLTVYAVPHLRELRRAAFERRTRLTFLSTDHGHVTVQHPVSGPALALDLAEELRIVHEQLATTSRTARTLVQNGSLRVTLMGIAAGGAFASHSADGPITVHVLEGTIEFEADGKTWMLSAGSLFALDAGIVHSVRAAGRRLSAHGRRRASG